MMANRMTKATGFLCHTVICQKVKAVTMTMKKER